MENTMDPASPPAFSLRRRVQLCLAMLALESYISFEEIFMLAVLQRMQVPVLLVSMPGTISSAIGVFVIPLLGWASDRPTCCSKSCGQKRPFAFWTLSVSVTGVSLLLFLSYATLYTDNNANANTTSNSNTDDNSSNSNSTANGTVHYRRHNSSAFSLIEQRTALGLKGQSLKRRAPARDMSAGSCSSSISNTSTPALDEKWTSNTRKMTSASDNPVLSNTREMISKVGNPLFSTTSSWTTETNNQDFNSSLTAERSFPELDLTKNASIAMFIPLHHRHTRHTVRDQARGTASSEGLAPKDVLGMVGFVLADHGYDSSMSTFKAYMIAVTPAFQHESIFIMGTLIGAIGGCLTSLLGFVDLASIFPNTGAVLDKGMAQCLVQALLLLTELVVLGFVSLMTGSEDLQPDSGDSSSFPSDRETVVDEGNNVIQKQVDAPSSPEDLKLDSIVKLNESTPLTTGPLSGSRGCLALILISWRRWKQRVFLCVMTLLGFSTNYSYFAYVSNYVAEVIYQGDPNAASGSPAYHNYVEGVHVASLGMLTFYVLFVVFNIFHQQIIAKIGMRGEYLSASVACAALMLTLALTDNIVVFFVNAVTMAMFRAAVYTMPFILSNNLAQQEATERDEAAMASSGIAMATITAMIPGSYLVVSLVMGPLMDVTGNPGMPIFFALASCLLGIVSSAFVRFG